VRAKTGYQRDSAPHDHTSAAHQLAQKKLQLLVFSLWFVLCTHDETVPQCATALHQQAQPHPSFACTKAELDELQPDCTINELVSVPLTVAPFATPAQHCPSCSIAPSLHTHSSSEAAPDLLVFPAGHGMHCLAASAVPDKSNAVINIVFLSLMSPSCLY
jgi:hypothetical protein